MRAPADRESTRRACAAVHWARRAKQYVENNGFSPLLTSELTILPFRDNSNFIADGYYLAAPLLDPTIRMRDDDGDRESVIRHEFGHFLMWELQNRTFITLYSENNCSSHPFNAENTSRQAWTEGWADAIAMILDAAYWQEDGEYGQPFTRLKVPMYENNVRFYANPSLPFNNGIRSEYNLAASIYDLWDGANKGLPSQIPPKAANAVVDVSEVAVTISHGFNDQFTSVSDPDVSEAALHWESIDDVEYSFADIIEPLLAHRGLGNNIQHISAYFQYFLSDVVGNDCQQLANVSRVFRENRVLQDIDFYEVHAGNNCLNTDGIGMVIDFEDAAQICPFGNALITNYQDQYVTNYFPRSQNEIFNFPFLPIQSGSNIPGYYPYITDDLWLGNMGNNGFPTTSCIFSINGDGNFPSILQNGTLETCGGVDIELNNATMMLGNASSLTANLIFNAGSTLKISSNGVLIIHDNSKIIIESGAKLTIEQGAQIQLLGNNAILEIRDTLDLKDKAIFTFTGDGFVRFANGNTIIAASNSEIKFTGSSPSDKVVEIADNSFISNYNLVKTTLQHGRCELGQNAFWDTGNGQVLFTDAVFTALDNTKPYQTIYTNGQDPTIQDCQFSYGQTGLTARNFMSLGASITLTNVEIHHCNIALRDYDKGAHLENVHFHHNNIGWKAAYQAFNSQLLNSEIDNNTYEGVTFTGNTNLAVESPNIHHNLYGLDFIGAGNLVPVCGGVIFNGSTGIGGYQNAKIQLSGNPLSSPKVNLSYNTTSSVFLWGARVYLNEGRNNLSPEQGGMALAVITPQTNSLNAKHNHWNENSIPYGTSPVFGTDYNLYSIGSANPVNVIDNQPIEYESCNGIIQRQMYIPECVECEVIKTPHFDYVRIDSALRQVAEDLYEYSRFQHVAANYGLLTEILEFAYTKSDITQDEVLNIALDIAKYTFAEGIATATISYNSTGEIGQPAAKIFQLIDSRITNTLDTPSVFYRKIDKAILYNLLQRPALSLTVLNAITTENAEQAEYQAYWTCFVELRRDMQLQTIESAEITRRLAVCPAISRPSQGANKMESPQIAASLSLFPNPSQAEVQISLFSPQENEASLAVYDIQGRKVQEIALFACQKGTNMLSLSATSLTNGMYSVVIQLGNEVLSHKWLVQK